MQVPRPLLKNVRTVLRRLKPDRNARLGPPWLVLRAGPQGLEIQAQDTEVALSFSAAGCSPFTSCEARSSNCSLAPATP